MIDSTDLAQVLSEADDIARSVSQRVTSAHLLLALFTVENRAQLLLKERGVDEDLLLHALTSAPAEPDTVVRELCVRARDIATGCGSPEADCLHLLIATTRVRCLAQELLSKVGLDLTALRNTALSFYLGGRMPRKLQLARPQQRVANGRPVSVQTAPPPPTPIMNLRELVDADDDPAPIERPAPVAIAAPPAVHHAEIAPSSSPFSLDAKAFPTLAALGRNLTQAAHEGKLDPVIGRTREVEEVIDILGKRRANNPCLVGEPGVGKTAVVEGVAQRLLALKAPLADRLVIELDMATLVAGTSLRGSFSERLNALKDEVRRADGRVVVFIDELHTLIGAGSTGDGPQDAANELKSAMARGEFPCIGATTHDEYRKYIHADPALERRFAPVVVKEPSTSETVEILKGVVSRYEQHHRLRYAPSALEASASLASKYITDRFLPDKAISVLDLAGSRCAREGRSSVEARDVAQVVAKIAGIPEERLLMNDSARLLRMEQDLAARVIGHEENLSRIARVVRRNYAGFSSRRPLGSFLFLGPTGVGKTELARAIAHVLFGSQDAVVRLDMSEMSEGHGVSRLIGAPAGYVGYGDGGALTEAVRRRPSSVVVFDELEKAHRDVLMLLLQVLDEGRLTDGKGRHIDFSNTVIVLTSNLGAEQFGQITKTVGFGAVATAARNEADAASSAARAALPPELWNRIDERLVFKPLAETDVARIASLLLADSSRRLEVEKNISYAASDEVVTHLLRAGGFDPRLGARPMRQTLQRLIEAPLAERILAGDFLSGDRVRVALRSGQIAFAKEA